MIAVIESGGKQHKVSEGDTILLESLPQAEGEKIEFDKVLILSDGKDSKIGTPFLENVKVTAKITKHLRGKKTRVFKMKRRKDYRRTIGHRQGLTEVLIEKIK